MLHALGHFIFKRQFWQNTMIYGTSEFIMFAGAIILYMTGDVFDEMIWTPWKSAKIQWDPGSRVPQDLLDPCSFSRNFGLVKDSIESGVKGNINAISYNRNKSCIFIILIRMRNQWKRWLGSWRMSAYRRRIYRLSPDRCKSSMPWVKPRKKKIKK